MQRVLSLVFCAALAACSGRVVPAPSDAAPPSTSLEAPIGAACSATESFWCSNYAGVCVLSVCRAWCSAVEVPRCAGNAHEAHDDLGYGMACFCMPD
ncbi:MAG TPA: hypothetical protein VIX73_28975 [Kofleriaceae bacterium]|jgi:hypothetical protein